MADSFARAVARVVVTKICESMSFEGIQNSAADTLSDLMLRYISELGAAAHKYAELAGRFESNLNDVLVALEDLGTSVSGINFFSYRCQ
jgi:transcription initiation factor TFIID subunit 8